LVNKLNSFNSNEIKPKSLQNSGVNQKDDHNSGLSFKEEKNDSELTESLKETIGALRNSIAQNRTDRVQYDMTNLDHGNENDLKFL
jgi:hypothetical protein